MALPGPLVLTLGPCPQFIPGRHLVNGDALNTVSALVGSSNSGVTAFAGGGRSGAYNIIAAFTQLSVVANAADSVVLPKSYPGMRCTIQNDGVASAQVFANGSDTIQGTAGATGVALANGATAEYVCVIAGQWKRYVSS